MLLRDYITKGIRYATVGGLGALINWGTQLELVNYFGKWSIWFAVLASFLTVVTNYNMLILWKVVKIGSTHDSNPSL